MLLTTFLVVLVLTLRTALAGIHCDANTPCPWYCLGTCGCCGTTCWFGAKVTQCQNAKCGICTGAAKAALKFGSKPACMAGATAACIAAGAGPEDPVADAVCPALTWRLCSAIFGAVTNKAQVPETVCANIGYCSVGETGDEEKGDAEEGDGEASDEEDTSNGGVLNPICMDVDHSHSFEPDAKDIYPFCDQLNEGQDRTITCATSSIKENCAGTCSRCPIASYVSNGMASKPLGVGEQAPVTAEECAVKSKRNKCHRLKGCKWSKRQGKCLVKTMRRLL